MWKRLSYRSGLFVVAAGVTAVASCNAILATGEPRVVTGDGGSGGSGGKAATITDTSTSPSTTSTGTGGAGGMGGMGAGGGGVFDCVGDVMYPAPANAMATLLAVTEDPQTNNPVAGITVKACDQADTACASSIAMALSDAQGQVAAIVPTPMPYGFDGFFQSSSNKTVTTNYFFRPIAAQPAQGAIPLLVITDQQISIIGTLVGHQPDPTRTHVEMAGTDCVDSPAAGLTFSIDTADANTAVTYFANNLPDPKATQTDASGIALVLNLPPGGFTATMKLGATTVGIMSGHADKGQVAAMRLGPTP